MKSIQRLYQSQKYQSNTQRVISRTPLTNYSTIKTKESSNLNTYKNITLGNRSLIESLNIERRVYIYVDKIPNSNVIHYNSNLKKYKTLSKTIKEPSNNDKTLNLSNQQNILNKNKIDYSNNKYNKTTGSNAMNKSSNLEIIQNRRGNRNVNSTSIKANMTQNVRTNKNLASSRNEAQSGKENQV